MYAYIWGIYLLYENPICCRLFVVLLIYNSGYRCCLFMVESWLARLLASICSGYSSHISIYVKLYFDSMMLAHSFPWACSTSSRALMRAAEQRTHRCWDDASERLQQISIHGLIAGCLRLYIYLDLLPRTLVVVFVDIIQAIQLWCRTDPLRDRFGQSLFLKHYSISCCLLTAAWIDAAVSSLSFS